MMTFVSVKLKLSIYLVLITQLINVKQGLMLKKLL
jgi:hypothetical protein